MKLKHLYTFLGLSLLMPLGGCIHDDMPPCEGVSQESLAVLPVSFKIQLAVEGQNTRTGDPGIWTPGKEEDGETDKKEGENREEIGTDFDNTINTITPVLYYYSGSSKAIHAADPVATLISDATIKFSSTSTNIKKEYVTVNGKEEFQGTYTVTTDMTCSYATRDMLLKSDNMRMAVYINCSAEDIHSALDVTKPAEATFFHHGQPDDVQDNNDSKYKHFHGIPMYGVADVKFKEVEDDTDATKKVMKIFGTDENPLSIHVLRSMAKVRVKLNNEIIGTDKKVRLKSLVISRHAKNGYVVPKGWDTATDMSTQAINGGAMNPHIGLIAGDNADYDYYCKMEPQEEKDPSINDKHKGDKDYYANSEDLLRLYLPDTYNHINDGDNNSKEIYLKIRYTIDGVNEGDNEKIFTHVLWFRPRADWPSEEGNEYSKSPDGFIYLQDNIRYPAKEKGAPWDIIRNHIYEFVIEGVEATFDLKIGVSVKKWDYHVIPTEL